MPAARPCGGENGEFVPGTVRDGSASFALRPAPRVRPDPDLPSTMKSPLVQPRLADAALSTSVRLRYAGSGAPERFARDLEDFVRHPGEP